MPDRCTHALGFDQEAAQADTEPSSDAGHATDMPPGSSSCYAWAGHADFHRQRATLTVPGLDLALGSITPATAARCVASTLLLIPLRGERNITVDGRRLPWGAAQGCLFLPAGTRVAPGSGGDLEFLRLQLDLRLLEAAARAMRAPYDPCQSIDLQTRHARVLPLAVGGALLVDLVRQIGALIDLYDHDAQLLQQLGLRDFIYRHLVLLFRPDWLAGAAASAPKPHKRRAVDRVCDLLQQDLGRAATLTEMAAHAHMSVRTLQYAFQSRFGMSPLDWLREQRLALARSRLLQGDHAGITALAQDCGFGSASRFAAAYRQRYGETPSATAASARFAQSASLVAQPV